MLTQQDILNLALTQNGVIFHTPKGSSFTKDIKGLVESHIEVRLCQWGSDIAIPASTSPFTNDNGDLPAWLSPLLNKPSLVILDGIDFCNNYVKDFAIELLVNKKINGVALPDNISIIATSDTEVYIEKTTFISLT